MKWAVDLTLMAGAVGWAWLISSAGTAGTYPVGWLIAGLIGAQVAAHLAIGAQHTLWRRVSSDDALRLAASAALSLPLLALVLYALPAAFGRESYPRAYIILAVEPIFYLVLLGGARLGARATAETYRDRAGARRVLLVGSGDAARSLVWQIQNSNTAYHVVGLVDDDPKRRTQRVLGLPVLGAIADVLHLVPELAIDQIVIAIPSLSPEQLREVLEKCEATGRPIRIVPPLRELMDGAVNLAGLREVRMEDLLPRPEIKLDEEAISRYLKGKVVLVTGGGGSIGSEVCRQVLRFGAARLLVLGRGENSVFEATQDLAALHSQCRSGCEVIPVVCDVQDRADLAWVFETYRPEVVFHAAAHKHVPLMEQYPLEAISNNVMGSLNVVTLSVEYGVSRFVLVSTDKAVEPTSVMGSTKRVAELIVKGYAMAKQANMVSVRFGNVLGSRGSVVPMMARQIRNGQPVTITDPEMVRYFMTIPEATQLILQAGAIGGQGDVFVLDMGRPVKVMDLAKDLIRLSGRVPEQDVPIRIIGRRPGEKLREDILNQAESEGAKKNGHFYIAPPEPVDLLGLLYQIKRLERAAAEHRADRVVRILQALVPGFSPDAAHLAVLQAEAPFAPVALRQAS